MFATAFSMFYIGYRKNQDPHWRSKKEVYLDAFKVLSILKSLADSENQTTQAS